MSAVSANGQVKLKKIAALPDAVYETSGLICYKDKYLITHNDGGHKSEVFVLNLKGELVKKVNVDDTKNKDWEDLAQDDDGRLFIGDFGNNDNARKKCHIYILPPDYVDQDKVEPEKITFTYEDQEHYPAKKKNRNYDCEAFFWMEGKLYLLTKCRTKPFTGECRIYELPDKPGKYKAKYKGSVYLCTAGWRLCSITGADYNPKTNTIAIITYSRMYLLSDFEGDHFWNGSVQMFSMPFVKQREAVCFAGKDRIFLTDEERKGIGGGNLYEVKIK
ncbi:MAG: hypothetical protein ACPG21_02635 [Crocinitomicaceae bacterium]